MLMFKGRRADRRMDDKDNTLWAKGKKTVS